MYINDYITDLHRCVLWNINSSLCTVSMRQIWSSNDLFIFFFFPPFCSQFGLTFSAVFGVIVYRITVSALIAMSPDPETKSNVRVTVTATAVLINLVVILILDEIYGTVALWLTELGTQIQTDIYSHSAVALRTQCSATFERMNKLRKHKTNWANSEQC